MRFKVKGEISIMTVERFNEVRQQEYFTIVLSTKYKILNIDDVYNNIGDDYYFYLRNRGHYLLYSSEIDFQ